MIQDTWSMKVSLLFLFFWHASEVNQEVPERSGWVVVHEGSNTEANPHPIKSGTSDGLLHAAVQHAGRASCLSSFWYT